MRVLHTKNKSGYCTGKEHHWTFERKRIQGEYAHAMKDEERLIYRVAT